MSKFRRTLTVLGGFVLVATSSVHAQKTWDGGGADSNWTTGANWVGDVAPAFSVNETLTFTGSTDLTPVADSQPWTDLQDIIFDANAGAFTLSGFSLTFQDGFGIRNQDAGDGSTQTIENDLIGTGTALDLDATDGDLIIQGDIDLSDTGGVTLTVTASNDTIINGVISGAGGSVSKFAAGTLTLNAANTYDGGTNLANGTIEIGNNSALGTGALTVSGTSTLRATGDDRTLANDISLNGVALTIAGANDMTLNGTVSGTGSLAKVDAGTLTLNDANTYSGGTILSAGTLAVGDDAALGTGTLTVAGGSTLTASGGARSLANNVVLNDTLTITGSNNLTLSGVISGASGMNMNGTGTLTLSGANTFTGTLDINSGIVVLSGATGGSVLNASLLQGTGTVGGDLTIESGGTIAPGNSIGTMVVADDFTLATGATYQVEIDATNDTADLLDVGGNATLANDSAVVVTQVDAGAINVGDTFTIIEADGTITDNGADISFAGGGGIDFFGSIVAGTPSLYQIVAFASAFESRAVGENNIAIAQVLDEIDQAGASGDMATLLTQITSIADNDTFNQTLRELTPEVYDSTVLMNVENTTAYMQNLGSYFAARRMGAPQLAAVNQSATTGPMLASAASDPQLLALAIAAGEEQEEGENNSLRVREQDWSVFGRAFGVFQDQDTEDDRIGFKSDSYGGVVGMDYVLSDHWLVGASLGYVRSDIDLAQNRGEMDEDVVRVGPYIAYDRGPWYADAAITYGYHTYDADRNIPSLGREADSEWEGHDVTVFGDIGYEMQFDTWTVTPNASAQYIYLYQESFNETDGGAANLAVDSRDTESLRTRLGVNIATQWDTSWFTLVPEFFIGWEHEALADDENLEARFTTAGSTFSYDTEVPGRNRLFLGTGVAALLDDSTSAYVRYEGLLSHEGESHAISTGLTFRF